MNNKKTTILVTALISVMAIPAVAFALNAPADSVPTTGTAAETAPNGDSFGWMGQMHEYMWNNNETLTDQDAAWMNQMHDSIWNDGTLPDDLANTMDQMHEYMWNNNETLTDQDAAWMNQMHDSIWNDGQTIVPDGSGPMGSGGGMGFGR
jgi:hypothetical protein